MVTLKQLQQADSSFFLKTKHPPDIEFAGISNIDNIRPESIVLIKKRKFFNELIQQINSGLDPATISVIFEKSFLDELSAIKELALLTEFGAHGHVDSVDLAMSRFSKVFYSNYHKQLDLLKEGRTHESTNIDPTAHIAEGVFIGINVTIGKNAVVHPGCVIQSNCKIGDNTMLYANVVLYTNVQLGQDCIIHANTTIGSDGFSYNFAQGKHLKVWHLGGVVIEDEVEIGSGSSVDQGTFSPTQIGAGTKIDNQCHIAHNCKLGKGVVICGQSGLAGSVTLGDYVIVGGAVNIAPDMCIGNQAQIGGMSGVTGHIPPKAVYGGHPARPLKEWLKSNAKLRRISLNQNKAGESTST